MIDRKSDSMSAKTSWRRLAAGATSMLVAIATAGCGGYRPVEPAPVDERYVDRRGSPSGPVSYAVIENNPDVRTVHDGANTRSGELSGELEPPPTPEGVSIASATEQTGAQELRALEPGNTNSDDQSVVARAAPSRSGDLQAIEDTNHANPAVASLLSDAAQAESNGDLNAASASLERALRISPNDAGLWHQLAAVKLRQGDVDQAQAFARKSNALAGNDAALRARNAKLISAAGRAAVPVDGSTTHV